MDKEAVRNSSEEDLKSLGLNERGHLICLKCFSLECENNKSHDSSLPIEIRKKELAISVKKGGTDRLPTSPNVSRLKKKSVLLGWMNYDNLKNKYIGVRASRGGGIRTVHFRNEIDASVILDEAKTLFFPCGKSNFGNIDKFIVNLGNYKGELITGNELENFTLSEYIRTNKLSKTRLYMLTRKKSPNRIILDQANSFIYASDDEIDSLDFSILLTMMTLKLHPKLKMYPCCETIKP